jgi:hypothetical protein
MSLSIILLTFRKIGLASIAIAKKAATKFKTEGLLEQGWMTFFRAHGSDELLDALDEETFLELSTLCLYEVALESFQGPIKDA